MYKKIIVQTNQQKIDWRPTPKQSLFLSCPADEILFGGAAAAGKSDALLIAACGPASNGIFNNPNWKALLLRRTFQELESTLIIRSQALLKNKAKYDMVKHRWTFPHGGTLQFGHVMTERDVFNYQSAEYNFIGFDELTHFSEFMYKYLFSRRRTTDPTIKCQVMSASNPGGFGHAWVKDRFIKDKQKNKIYEYDIKLPDNRIMKTTRCFIPATVFDNPHIMDNDPGYVARLMQLPEIQKKALLYGDWEIFSGQFFAEFSEKHICNPFDIPDDWPIWLSMDWGYATKCWVGWWTENPQTETVYLFNELYETKKSPSEIARMIKDKSGKKFLNIRGRYADRRISVKDEESGISTREKFSMEGIYWQMANSDRINGWQRCREMLKLDKEGSSVFQVFVTCENFIRTVPEQVHDLKNVEDMDKDGETHASDGFRYFAISRKSGMNEQREYNEEMNFNKITGYPDLTNNRDSVIRIKRLPNLVGDIKDYFIDRHR